MLPADVIGISIFDRERSEFRFLPGALFSQVLLADEINRATPKTQSALLEAMEERQVTTEGETRPLPEPFFVIATQNPSSQIGTFPLPESQLDRFLMRIELGYPDRDAERRCSKTADDARASARTGRLLFTRPARSAAEAGRCRSCFAGTARLFANADRDNASQPEVHSRSEPRAALALLAAAAPGPSSSGRTMVLPEDVQAVLPGVACHRLRLVNSAQPCRPEDVTQLIRAIPLA